MEERSLKESELRDLVKAIEAGAPFEDACRYANAPIYAVRDIIEQGEEWSKAKEWRLERFKKSKALEEYRQREGGKEELMAWLFDRKEYADARLREYNQIKRAESLCVMYHLQRMRTDTRSWQASAWFLERKRGDQFGKPSEAQGGALKLDGVKIVFTAEDDERKERLRRLEEEAKRELNGTADGDAGQVEADS